MAKIQAPIILSVPKEMLKTELPEDCGAGSAPTTISSFGISGDALRTRVGKFFKPEVCGGINFLLTRKPNLMVQFAERRSAFLCLREGTISAETLLEANRLFSVAPTTA